MEWQGLALATMAASTVATGLTAAQLWRSWDVRVSSVRWLFFCFFLYLWLWSCMRCLYFIYVAIWPLRILYSAGSEQLEAFDRYSSMSIYTILQWKVTDEPFVTVVLCLADSLLFASALIMVPLTHELSLIASKSMDRGEDKERAQIRRYSWAIHGALLVFAAVEAALAAAYGGYSEQSQRCLLSVYLLEFLSFFYMIWLVVRLKLIGRKYENVQGQFVTSPVYQRLKRIMLVYGLFSFQYQAATFFMYVFPDSEEHLLDFISVSLLLYHMSGLALSVTTMCSQTCVLQTCRWCLPSDVEAQLETRLLEQDLLSPREPRVLDTEPPMVDPVFVFTDIESSSALWAIGDGSMMQRATEIHDNILRAVLTKYRGYEITTAGDAFQLAFHTVREAVEYCLDVQLQLLVANWPKELHNAVPATRKLRVGHRLVFNGLRVRMGIHDAADSDGPLILDVHAVTGKMIYTGAAEVIANEIGDLGDGGQILVTKRVADWLRLYEDLVAIECVVERVGQYAMPHLHATLEVFQLLPEVLAGRKKTFTCNLRKRSATSVSSGPTRYSQRTEYRERLRRLRAQQRAQLRQDPDRRRARAPRIIRVDHGSFYPSM